MTASDLGCRRGPDAAAPTPGRTDGVLSVTGILAEGADEESVRVYLDPSFATYHEIPKAVTHRQHLDEVESPFGMAASVLLVRHGTPIVVQRSSERTIDQEFLAGDFTAPVSFRSLAWSSGLSLRRLPGVGSVYYKTHENFPGKARPAARPVWSEKRAAPGKGSLSLAQTALDRREQAQHSSAQLMAPARVSR